MFRRDQYFRHWQFDFNFLFQLSEPFYLFNLNLLSSKQRLLSISDSSRLTYFEIQLWWRRSIKKVIKRQLVSLVMKLSLNTYRWLREERSWSNKVNFESTLLIEVFLRDYRLWSGRLPKFRICFLSVTGIFTSIKRSQSPFTDSQRPDCDWTERSVKAEPLKWTNTNLSSNF